MEKKPKLGISEAKVLIAIQELGSNAYGVTVRRHLEEEIGRTVSISAVYTELSRLEDKGFVTSRLGEATPERGGRAKMYFAITGQGQSALSELQRVFGGGTFVPSLEVRQCLV